MMPFFRALSLRISVRMDGQTRREEPLVIVRGAIYAAISESQPAAWGPVEQAGRGLLPDKFTDDDGLCGLVT
jgi:hypothetical protein